MAYTGNYTADDLDDVIIDFIGRYIGAGIAFVSLIVIVALVVWLKRSKLHKGF